VLVIIGWPGQTERYVDGAWRQPCDPVYDSWYTEEIHSALEIVGHGGARVFLTTAPYLRAPVTPEATDLRTDCLNAIYRRLADPTPASSVPVALIDLAGYICPEGNCRTEDNGTVLRPDGLHYEGASAIWTAEWVLGKIWSS
jgi:hypothetical protein